MKNFITPLSTNRAWLRISKVPKTIESKIQKYKFFTAQTMGNFSECIQFRMHFCATVSQTKSVGVGLKNILTHRDNFALVNYKRYMLFLTLHSHRKRLGYGQVILYYSINIHSLQRQLQTRLVHRLRRSDESLIQTCIILILKFI